MSGGLDSSDERRARTRFMLIQFLRLAGVGMVIFALAIINHAVALPRQSGWVLLGLGLVDIFVLPQVLVRAWRSPLP